MEVDTVMDMMGDMVKKNFFLSESGTIIRGWWPHQSN